MPRCTSGKTQKKQTVHAVLFAKYIPSTVSWFTCHRSRGSLAGCCVSLLELFGNCDRLRQPCRHCGSLVKARLLPFQSKHSAMHLSVCMLLCISADMFEYTYKVNAAQSLEGVSMSTT